MRLLSSMVLALIELVKYTVVVLMLSCFVFYY